MRSNKKMSASERIYILEEAIHRLQTGRNDFICGAISGAMGIYDWKNEEPLKYFPELLKHKPLIRNTLGWWRTSDTKTRILVIQSVIEEIKSKQS